MRTHRKLILAALVASMLFAIGVTSASAGRLNTNERNFELIWSEALGAPKTKIEFRFATINVRCKLTLLGSFIERTIKKEGLINQGTINHGTFEACEGGTAAFIGQTGWTFRYRSFTGLLPVIRSVTLGFLAARIRIREPSANECEISTEAAKPAVGIIGNSAEAPETGFERTGEPENVTAEKNNRIPLGGGTLCMLAREAELGGIGLIRNLPQNAKLRVTLI